MNSLASKNEKDFNYPTLQLNGSVAFDNNGDKVIISTKGKAFATDDTILEIWHELEKLSLKQLECQGNIEKVLSYFKQVRFKDSKMVQVKNIVSKLAAHELILF